MKIPRNAAMAALLGAAAFFALAPSRVLAQSPAPTRSPEEIDQIVGPIALYPDPLVSIVLPAATMPDEIQAAAQVVANGDTSNVDNPSWDDSVRAVAHYPDLVEWMNDNIDWTAQLGATFTAQPAEVLNSVQRLRTRARAVGTLVDTPQQRVVLEGDLIAIVPAEPSVIYVPRYDPAVVYLDHPSRRGAAAFGFSVGFATGAWLTYDFDWRRHELFVADRTWASHRDWTRPSFAVAVGMNAAAEHRREWRPSPNRARADVHINISRNVVTPRAMSERSARTEAPAGAMPGTVSQNQPRPAAGAAPVNNNNNQPTNLSLNERERIRERNRAQGIVNAQNPAANPPPNAVAPNGAISADEMRRQREERLRTENRAAGVLSQTQIQAEREKAAVANAQPKAPPSPAPQTPPATALSANERRERAQQQQPAARQATPPVATPANQNQTRNGALSANEPAANADDRKKGEANRRPTPRGSITAGSTGEYPMPPENHPAQAHPNPAAAQQAQAERERALAQQRATPPQQARPVPQVRAPASTQPPAPQVQNQNKPQTAEEKAKQQQQEEEEKKKRKKPDSDGT